MRKKGAAKCKKKMCRWETTFSDFSFCLVYFSFDHFADQMTLSASKRKKERNDHQNGNEIARMELTNGIEFTYECHVNMCGFHVLSVSLWIWLQFGLNTNRIYNNFLFLKRGIAICTSSNWLIFFVVVRSIHIQ